MEIIKNEIDSKLKGYIKPSNTNKGIIWIVKDGSVKLAISLSESRSSDYIPPSISINNNIITYRLYNNDKTTGNRSSYYNANMSFILPAKYIGKTYKIHIDFTQKTLEFLRGYGSVSTASRTLSSSFSVLYHSFENTTVTIPANQANRSIYCGGTFTTENTITLTSQNITLPLVRISGYRNNSGGYISFFCGHASNTATTITINNLYLEKV